MEPEICPVGHIGQQIVIVDRVTIDVHLMSSDQHYQIWKQKQKNFCKSINFQTEYTASHVNVYQKEKQMYFEICKLMKIW